MNITEKTSAPLNFKSTACLTAALLCFLSLQAGAANAQTLTPAQQQQAPAQKAGITESFMFSVTTGKAQAASDEAGLAAAKQRVSEDVENQAVACADHKRLYFYSEASAVAAGYTCFISYTSSWKPVKDATITVLQEENPYTPPVPAGTDPYTVKPVYSYMVYGENATVSETLVFTFTGEADQCITAVMQHLDALNDNPTSCGGTATF